MAFQLQIGANTPPPNSCYPATWAQALKSIAQNLFVTGLGALNSFNFGPSTPATDLQDRPWLKTDSLYKFLGVYTFTQGVWAPADPAFPPGTILDFYGQASSIAAPFYNCTGQAIVGPVNGALTTPNLQGLVTLGTGTNATTGTIFANQVTGGEENHALTANENGPHFHTFNTGAAGGGSGQVADTGNSGNTGTVNQSGSGLPHNTLQPYMAVYKIIFWP